VVVVAAGQGRRAGAGDLKPFRPVGGVPLLLRAIRPFVAHPAVGQVVVVLPEQFALEPPDWLASLAGERLRLAAGGVERIDSVERGLRALDGALAVVLVHDGARPFPDPGVIDAVIEQARAGRAAIAALPMSDTVKEGVFDPALGAAVVRRTVPRDGLWRAQTPQGFPRDLLTRACQGARATGLAATDDAAMVEALGEPVVLVPDVPRNLKLTVPGDFAMANALAELGP
jgi:2-C-methyl-D-erythritol 4-phosphate cytidylyltransferase